MLHRVEKFVSRRLAPLLTAGMLLQVGGCETTAGEIAAGLAAAVVTQLINGIVFAAFNLAT